MQDQIEIMTKMGPVANSGGPVATGVVKSVDPGAGDPSGQQIAMSAWSIGRTALVLA